MMFFVNLDEYEERLERVARERRRAILDCKNHGCDGKFKFTRKHLVFMQGCYHRCGGSETPLFYYYCHKCGRVHHYNGELVTLNKEIGKVAVFFLNGFIIHKDKDGKEVHREKPLRYRFNKK